MKTKSEEVFEGFLTLNELRFTKIPVSTSWRPDYLVAISNVEVIFEVKELTEHEQFGTIGDHVRRAIHGSRKQVQYGAERGLPSVLLIYNNFDPCQAFGTDDLDFRTAMYGELTALIDKKTRESSQLFHGGNQLLQEAKNTSFSAVGRLAERFERIEVTLFENAYAKIRLPFDQLPPCFGVKRVNVVNAPLEFT